MAGKQVIRLLALTIGISVSVPAFSQMSPSPQEMGMMGSLTRLDAREAEANRYVLAHQQDLSNAVKKWRAERLPQAPGGVPAQKSTIYVKDGMILPSNFYGEGVAFYPNCCVVTFRQSPGGTMMGWDAKIFPGDIPAKQLDVKYKRPMLEWEWKQLLLRQAQELTRMGFKNSDAASDYNGSL